MFKNQKGFTLIEMLIVLLIISVLIILIVPNLGDKSKAVDKKGCKALVEVVQAQVDSYYLDKKEYPSGLEDMVSDYIKEEQITCPNKKDLSYNPITGEVSKPE
jgi:competence protein ComGC